MSIEDLCGKLKSYSDLKKHPVKVRYTESTEVKAGGWFRMTLSRHSDASGPWYLDCRKVFLRFRMKVAEIDNEKCWIDGPTAACIFDRVKIVCNSTVICDIQNHSLLATFLENIYHSEAGESPAVRTMRGHGTAQKLSLGTTDTTEFIIPISPIGTLLNSKNLLPLNSIGDIHIEFYLGMPQSVLGCANPTKLGTYSIYDIEMHSHYLSSKSIQSFFASNPVQMSCIDYSYRFNTVPSTVNMLKISSSYTSLNAVVGYLRMPNVYAAESGYNRRLQSYPAGGIVSMQFYAKNIALYDIPIETRNQQFREFLEAFPSVEHSDYYTDFSNQAQFLVCVNMRASPKEFVHQITSGLQTSSLNSDLCLQLNMQYTQSDLALESFLIADVIIHSNGKDLHIKY